jgi:hypothetical protein
MCTNGLLSNTDGVFAHYRGRQIYSGDQRSVLDLLAGKGGAHRRNARQVDQLARQDLLVARNAADDDPQQKVAVTGNDVTSRDLLDIL